MVDFSRRQTGFTLVELVLVILILGVLSVTVAPRYVDMRKNAERALAEQFGAALKEAESNYVVRAVTTAQNPGFITYASFVTFSGPPNPAHTFQVDPAIRAALVDPGGLTVNATQTRITLRFRSGARADYVITPASGEIRIWLIGFTAGGGCAPG